MDEDTGRSGDTNRALVNCFDIPTKSMGARNIEGVRRSDYAGVPCLHGVASSIVATTEDEITLALLERAIAGIKWELSKTPLDIRLEISLDHLEVAKESLVKKIEHSKPHNFADAEDSLKQHWLGEPVSAF